MPRRRARTDLTLVLVTVLAAAAGGCSAGSQVVEDVKEGHFLNKPVFNTPDWAQLNRAHQNVHLGPQGPVKPEDLVNAAGQCAPEEVPVAAAKPAPAASPEPEAAQPPAEPKLSPAAARAEAQVGSMAGDLASAPMPQGPPPAPPPRKPTRLASAKPDEFMDRLQPEGITVTPRGTGTAGVPLGGIALGMTECQAVRRAGHPSHVTIEAGTKGERQVVLTYLEGPWPGIYTFESGRLKVVDANPDQLNPVEPVKKKKLKKKPRTAVRSPPKKEDVYVQ